MEFPDLTQIELYQWLAIGGGVLALLAVVLYFLPVSKIKIPGVVVGVIGGLLAGVGVGVLAMAAFGYELNDPREKSMKAEQSSGPPQGGMGGGQKGKGGKGGPKGGMGGMPPPPQGFPFAPPTPDRQLAGVILRLDVLTEKTPAIQLSDEQKEKLAEELKELDSDKAAKLDTKEAKKRLEAIMKVLTKDQKEALQRLGASWPGQTSGAAGKETPPPFSEESNKKALKNLVERLGS
jgi:hypothetical protein